MPDPTYKNTAIDSDIKIDGNAQFGDNHNTYNTYEYSPNKVYFEEIKTEDLITSKYIPPVFTPVILEQMKKNRVVFIGGNANFNKTGLMHYLAGNVSGKEETLKVKESMGQPPVNSLLQAFRKESQNCVYLIYRASPDLLEYNFNELKQVASASKHYVLISTEVPKESWHLTESEYDIWYEITSKEAYYPEILVQKIKQDLKERNLTLPPLTDTKEIVTVLGTPENIDFFVERLSVHTPLTPAVVESCLRQSANSDASGIFQWFFNLPSDHKLLALGVALFDGLRESQFFDAMDILISDGWEGRKHNLKSLDYDDILPLLSYYRIENGYITSKYPEQNEQLLSIAWKSHRRFLEAALPVLTNLIIHSSSERVSNWNLFGNTWRRHILKQSISNALTIYGKIDFSSIETFILTLASNTDWEVRSVAAETLANLRNVLGDRWYHINDNWQTNIDVQRLVGDLIQSIQSEKSSELEEADPLNFIRATIAATLGSVAQKDAPNRLDNRVLEQVKRLAKVKDRLVTNSVQQTLRLISARHADQVSESLKSDFLQYSAFIEPIAAGLADRYNNIDPVSTKTIIFEWLDAINHHPIERSNYKDFLHEDKVLCCCILVLQYIDYEMTFSEGGITLEEAYQTLDFLRTISHQPRVRKYLLTAIVTLIEEHFKNPSHQAIHYISNLDTQERDQLVSGFYEQYIRQRSQLTGGEYRLTVKDKSLAGWENPNDRPKTRVELLMQTWLTHPEKVINQIATLALLKFGSFQELEQDVINAYAEEQKKLSEIKQSNELTEPDYDASIAADRYTEIFLKIASQVVLPQHKETLTKIAPALLQTSTYSDKSLANVFSRFDDVTSENDMIVLQLVYLYDLFKGKSLNNQHSPFRTGFWAEIFASGSAIPPAAHSLAKGWAPVLIQDRQISSDDARLILSKVSWGSAVTRRVMWCRFFDRNTWIWWVLIGLIAYLLVF